MEIEQIEQIINDEFRKHPNLNWSKIAAIKIHSSHKQEIIKLESSYNKLLEQVKNSKKL